MYSLIHWGDGKINLTCHHADFLAFSPPPTISALGSKRWVPTRLIDTPSTPSTRTTTTATTATSSTTAAAAATATTTTTTTTSTSTTSTMSTTSTTTKQNWRWTKKISHAWMSCLWKTTTWLHFHQQIYWFSGFAVFFPRPWARARSATKVWWPSDQVSANGETKTGEIRS